MQLQHFLYGKLGVRLKSGAFDDHRIIQYSPEQRLSEYTELVTQYANLMDFCANETHRDWMSCFLFPRSPGNEWIYLRVFRSAVDHTNSPMRRFQAILLTQKELEGLDWQPWRLDSQLRTDLGGSSDARELADVTREVKPITVNRNQIAPPTSPSTDQQELLEKLLAFRQEGKPIYLHEQASGTQGCQGAIDLENVQWLASRLLAELNEQGSENLKGGIGLGLPVQRDEKRSWTSPEKDLSRLLKIFVIQFVGFRLDPQNSRRASLSKNWVDLLTDAPTPSVQPQPPSPGQALTKEGNSKRSRFAGSYTSTHVSPSHEEKHTHTALNSVEVPKVPQHEEEHLRSSRFGGFKPPSGELRGSTPATKPKLTPDEPRVQPKHHTKRRIPVRVFLRNAVFIVSCSLSVILAVLLWGSQRRIQTWKDVSRRIAQAETPEKLRQEWEKNSAKLVTARREVNNAHSQVKEWKAAAQQIPKVDTPEQLSKWWKSSSDAQQQLQELKAEWNKVSTNLLDMQNQVAKWKATAEDIANEKNKLNEKLNRTTEEKTALNEKLKKTVSKTKLWIHEVDKRETEQGKTYYRLWVSTNGKDKIEMDVWPDGGKKLWVWWSACHVLEIENKSTISKQFQNLVGVSW
ncbi:MAG: hypothetical protein ACFCD0_16400 [Gemmataceae bacterium]